MAKIINLIGQKFGKLTVIEKAERRGPKERTRWRCACDCGKESVVEGQNLKSGNTTSCGCMRVEKKSKVRAGMRFGKLLVLHRDGSKRYGKVSFSNWKCVCDCGKFTSVIGMSLMNGDTTSCGCNISESSKKRATESFLDLSGKTFGQLVVIDRASPPGANIGNVKWLCACSCGGLTILRGNQITSGRTISCGCKKWTGETHRADEVRLKSRIANARRRAIELAAFHPFDIELFELVESEAYALAQRRTTETGFEWEVDHIVPLQSDIVCGLHGEHNLDVIPQSANSSKRNYHWPGMP